MSAPGRANSLRRARSVVRWTTRGDAIAAVSALVLSPVASLHSSVFPSVSSMPLHAAPSSSSPRPTDAPTREADPTIGAARTRALLTATAVRGRLQRMEAGAGPDAVAAERELLAVAYPSAAPLVDAVDDARTTDDEAFAEWLHLALGEILTRTLPSASVEAGPGARDARRSSAGGR